MPVNIFPLVVFYFGASGIGLAIVSGVSLRKSLFYYNDWSSCSYENDFGRSKVCHSSKNEALCYFFLSESLIFWKSGRFMVVN